MVSQELLDLVRQQKAARVEDSEIRHFLVANGWNASEVDQALAGFINTKENSPNQVPQPLSRSEATAELKRLGKFKASKLLFFQSLNLLRKDKEIVLFPVISAVASTVLLALFVGSLWLAGIVGTKGEEVVMNNDGLFYGALFIFYVISYFIVTYFRVGLTAVVYERINGRDIDFKAGMSKAAKISGKIFVWSLLSATVGLILQIISDRSKWLGKLVAGLFGAAWGLMTFFIAPTLLLDDVSVWQSVKNSGNIFRQTWGETLITNVSLGLVSFVAIISSLVVYAILGVAFASAGFGVAGFLVICVLAVLTVMAIAILSSCLSEIFKVALYSYARFGIIAEGFSPELIIGAVKEDKK